MLMRLVRKEGNVKLEEPFKAENVEWVLRLQV
jgi:hypothetical protein